MFLRFYFKLNKISFSNIFHLFHRLQTDGSLPAENIIAVFILLAIELETYRFATMFFIN